MTPENNGPATLGHHLMIQVMEQISELKDKLGEMSGDIKALGTTLDRLTPLVDKHEQRHNQVEGGMHVGKGIWTVLAGGGLGAVIATIGQWILPHPGQHP